MSDVQAVEQEGKLAAELRAVVSLDATEPKGEGLEQFGQTAVVVRALITVAAR